LLFLNIFFILSLFIAFFKFSLNNTKYQDNVDGLGAKGEAHTPDGLKACGRPVGGVFKVPVAASDDWLGK
jgi:hypothetical protein